MKTTFFKIPIKGLWGGKKKDLHCYCEEAQSNKWREFFALSSLADFKDYTIVKRVC